MQNPPFNPYQPKLHSKFPHGAQGQKVLHSRGTVRVGGAIKEALRIDSCCLYKGGWERDHLVREVKNSLCCQITQTVMNSGRTSWILILFVTPVLYGSNFVVVPPLPGEEACLLWALHQDLAYNPSTGLRETSGDPDTSGDECGPQRCPGEQEALGTNLQSWMSLMIG